MSFFYEISIRFYAFFIRIASLINPKAKAWVTGRKNYFYSLPNIDKKEVIWFHCASLGEFDQALPLMNLIKENHPEIFLLVTFFSPSGFLNYHKREHQCDLALYLPIDTKRNAKRFIKHFKPSKAFFVKYEFWSNYISALKKNKSEIYNVSGIFRESHRFFRWYGFFFRNTLRKFDFFFVQNESSKELLKSISITNCLVSGDSRYDRVLKNKEKISPNPIIEKFKGNSSLFIGGSTWKEGEFILSKWVSNWNGKLIIAPHAIDATHIKEIKFLFPKSILYSEIQNDDNLENVQVMILDTIGHLTNAYQYADMAYVGGGFSGNLHNILEPAVFHIPVFFGPKHSRFPEAKEFMNQQVGFEISTHQELKKVVEEALNSTGIIHQRSKQIFDKKAGASFTIYHKIFKTK